MEFRPAHMIDCGHFFLYKAELLWKEGLCFTMMDLIFIVD